MDNEKRDTSYRQKTLEAIHDNAVDAIITIDERGVIETVNPATETLLGYSADELIGQSVNQLMPDPYRSEHDRYIENYLESGLPKIIGIGREVVALKKDGSALPIHLAVSEINLDDHRVFAGVIRDLSDLRLIEEQRATLGRIIEDSLNEVFIFEVDSWRFIQANRGARDNLGYSLSELQALTPLDIKPKFSEQQFNDLLAPLLSGEKEKTDFRTSHRRKDGTTYDVDVHIHMSTYLKRPVFVAIILDVTQRRQAERLVQQQRESMQVELERLVETRTAELHQAQADLVRNEKFSTLGKVSGGIAHEIRNPLNAIKTSAYFLMNAKAPAEAKVKEHLERIDRQVTMIDNVITALSDVAKLPEAERISTSLEPILREVVRSLQLPQNIKAVFDLPQPTPAVLVDENQIVIAFRNLIRNARDAMPDGGTLTLSAHVADEEVTFTVSDTGIGIPAGHQEKIMEPLFTTKARGMGLGLSMTRVIVEKNQGKLSVESEPDQGSRFGILLKRT